MLEKIIKVFFLIVMGAMGLLLIITDIATAILEFKWWAFLVIPIGFVLFEIGFIAALLLSDWVVYAIKHHTFYGFLSMEKEFCNACGKEYNPETSGGIVNGHPFCTECLEKMGEDSAKLEIENNKLKEAIIILNNDLFDSCPVGDLSPEQSKFVENAKRWRDIINSVVDWRDMPK
ncbi:MAG TPA: hypothetical protein VHP38_02200 [Ruminiclostridium sp.]|nr:hypothetical protein [Ruminiclostridium sp.]